MVIPGEVVSLSDDGEQTLPEGKAVGFPQKFQNGVYLIYRPSEPERYIEVGSRSASETVQNPDINMKRQLSEKSVLVDRQGN